MIYLITYDLVNKSKDYSLLYQAIQSIGDVVHPLESVWFVDATTRRFNAAAIASLLRSHMEESDLLFVVQIDGSDRNGWMAKTAWAWLRNREQKSSAGAGDVRGDIN